jgi:hypothetical protein
MMIKLQIKKFKHKIVHKFPKVKNVKVHTSYTDSLFILLVIGFTLFLSAASTEAGTLAR